MIRRLPPHRLRRCYAQGVRPAREALLAIVAFCACGKTTKDSPTVQKVAANEATVAGAPAKPALPPAKATARGPEHSVYYSSITG